MVYDKDQYIKTYIGKDLRVRDNKNLRTILKMMLQNSHVKRISIKPVVLQGVSKKEHKEGSSFTKDDRCDQCDQSQSAFIAKNPKISRC